MLSETHLAVIACGSRSVDELQRLRDLDGCLYEEWSLSVHTLPDLDALACPDKRRIFNSAERALVLLVLSDSGDRRGREAAAWIREKAEATRCDVIEVVDQQIGKPFPTSFEGRVIHAPYSNARHGAAIVGGILEFIGRPGLICADYADFLQAQTEGGFAVGGFSESPEGLLAAIQPALKGVTRFLATGNLKGVVVAITGSSSVEIGDLSKIGKFLEQSLPEHLTLVLSLIVDFGLPEPAARATFIGFGATGPTGNAAIQAE